MAWISPKRNRERGITILLVAVAMFTILAVAALSVDIVTLYVARSEAQRASDVSELHARKTFFAKAWGNQPSTVIAKATAEAFNPSGPSASVPIQVASVKPWLIPNCDPHSPPPPPAPCSAGAYYFVNTADGSLNNPSAYIGQ